mmetsp:Transcript_12272/g.18488  ORF Transcript_12272/g.18488 Transcript_12272/m.18488 type:complete len:555 (-) Transcript_12272:486-2150(-)|eukprot:CAMPEP_0202732556 /NCGR_PEP_ID=MMETSP1385-20130828/187718_1 /ASSEMBLY_ACC=CAM_ASM_000861 /TAXON_ID=933848 /ORGANISM="Elphidium margaritaceum" /LENGTH=554 /DNA_ID=CAMNT_0049398875 /DNA_START=29 /DNA_END=1693 /DNA_ORIENTATION=+
MNNIRGAVDSILREFANCDKEREQWTHEKQQFQQQIIAYQQQLQEKGKEYETLLKRYKVLERSVHVQLGPQSTAIGGVPSNVLNRSDQQGKDIKIRLKRMRNKKQMIWARTLPAALSPQKLLGLIDDFSGKFAHTYVDGGGNVTHLDNAKEADKAKEDPPEEKVKEAQAFASSAVAATSSSVVATASSSMSTATATAMTEAHHHHERERFKLQLTPSVTLRHHLDCVRCLCMNDDESVLISGSDDGTLKLWDLNKIASSIASGGSFGDDLSERTIPITFRGHASSISTMCVLPNSNTLVTGSFDGNIFGWRLPANGSILTEMESLSALRLFEMRQHTDIVWDIAANYSAPLIASISADHSIKLFNTDTQQLRLNHTLNARLMRDKYVGLTSVQWKQERLCVSTVSGHILSFDVEKQKVVSATHDSKIDNYCINRIYTDDDLHSNLVYCACDDSRVRLFDVHSNKCIISQKVHTESVTDLVLHSASHSILTASHDCHLRVWDFKVNKFSCIQDLEMQDTHPQKWSNGILALAFNNKYKWLLSAGANGVKLYQTNL